VASFRRVQSSASSYHFQYLLVSLNSFGNCLRFLPRLHFTYIFPLIICFRKQFIRKMWSTQFPLPPYLSFLLYVGWTFPPQIFVTLLSSAHAPYNWSSPSFYSTTAMLQIQNWTTFCLQFKSNILVNRIFLLNYVFASANLNLISRVHFWRSGDRASW